MCSSPSIVAAVLLLAVVPSSTFVPSPHLSATSCFKRAFVHWYVSKGMGDGAGEWSDDERLWVVDEKAVADGVATANILEVFPKPLAELNDMLSNFDDMVDAYFDDVADDFLNNRMGNGEVFYGKRRYKPSATVSSDYNGGGLSDWSKIEAAREFREERARIREEAIMEDARRQMEGLSP